LVDEHKFNPERFIGLKVPTLLLFGGESPAPMKQATETVHAVLSQSRIVAIPGEGHAAWVLPGPGGDFMAKELINFQGEA
jgi:pimeloyl-ACP methyl ester carboxylesterase